MLKLMLKRRKKLYNASNKVKNGNSFYYRRTENFHIVFFENIQNFSLNKFNHRLLKKIWKSQVITSQKPT